MAKNTGKVREFCQSIKVEPCQGVSETTVRSVSMRENYEIGW